MAKVKYNDFTNREIPTNELQELDFFFANGYTVIKKEYSSAFIKFTANYCIENNIQSINIENDIEAFANMFQKFLDSMEPMSKETKQDLEHFFYKMLQGKATNAISKVKTTNLIGQIDMLGNAEIKIDSTFTLRIKNYKTLTNGISTTTFMLLDCFLIHFTEQSKKDVRIRLPLRKYMEMRELNDLKSARAQVLSGIEALKLIEYEALEKIGGKWKPSGSISIYGGTGYIKNGIIYFNFNVDFFNVLLNYRVMEYSKETLRLNPKQHPHAYYFSRYIDENYCMNEGKERVSIITIKTLIKKSPLLPSYDEIIQSPTYKGNVYRGIIEPVIKDLDSIDRLFYDFIDKAGKIIDDPLITFKGTGGYMEFISSKIRINYSDYEQHTERIERRKRHTEKAHKIRSGKEKTKELEARIAALESAEKGG